MRPRKRTRKWTYGDVSVRPITDVIRYLTSTFHRVVPPRRCGSNRLGAASSTVLAEGVGCRLDQGGVMRLILVIAACFTPLVTTLPAFAQTPGNQNFIFRDGQWMVCDYSDCKPLSERTCRANHEARVSALLAEGRKVEAILASVESGWIVNGVTYACYAGDNPQSIQPIVNGLINDLLLAAFVQEQECLKKAADVLALARKPASRPSISTTSNSSSAKRSSGSTASNTSTAKSVPAVIPGGLLETAPTGPPQGPAPTGTPIVPFNAPARSR
jgi:hypothetical protein